MDAMIGFDTVQALGFGAGAATIFQLLKGDNWNVWLVRILAIGLGFSSGFIAGPGLDDNLVSATATLATHSVAFSDTRLGKALELHLLSTLFSNLSKAIEGKD
jgi:hypothetical protein